MTQDIASNSPRNINQLSSPAQASFADKRMTITFPGDLAQHLKWLAEQQGVSQAEAVRKAVALESYLRQALLEPGSKLMIKDSDSVREIIIR